MIEIRLRIEQNKQNGQMALQMMSDGSVAGTTEGELANTLVAAVREAMSKIASRAKASVTIEKSMFPCPACGVTIARPPAYEPDGGRN